MSGFFRSDRAPLAPPVTATIFEGRVGRVHAVGDGLIYDTGPEYRDVDEVKRIVDQLPTLKIYLGHPSIPASESGQKEVGYVEAGRLDEDTAVARMVISDQGALDAINSDTTELSLGYYRKLVDGYQKDIKLDHLAIVDRARCGPVCALRTDEIVKAEITETIKASVAEAMTALRDQGAILAELPGVNPCTCKTHAIVHTNGESMSDTTLTAEMADLKAKLEAANKKLDELEVAATNAKKDAEVSSAKVLALETDLATAKSDAAAAVSQAKADAEAVLATELQARVDARVALVVEAAKIIKDDISKMSDRDIKIAVVKHVDGDEIPAEKSMDYVSGVYEGALKRAAGACTSREAVRVSVDAISKTVPVKPSDIEKSAKDNMKRASANAWATK